MSPRVLHIITGLDSGGAENTLLRLALLHKERGVETQVISLKSGGQLEERFAKSGLLLGSAGFGNGLWNSFVGFWHLHKLVRSYRPSVVQTWMYHADLMGALLLMFLPPVRLIWNIRRNNLSLRNVKGRTYLIGKLCAWLSHIAPDKIVCCAESAVDPHVSLGYCAKKIVVIPNGVDTNRFRPNHDSRNLLRSSLKIEKDACLIGMVGRMMPEKDHLCFLQMAKQLLKSDATFKFLLCGRGVSRNSAILAPLLATMPTLDDSLFLLEETNQIETIYPALDLHVLSSRSEGFPNVIAEAMACGIPCISTDCGDARKIIGDPQRIVAVGDPQALAEAAKATLASKSTGQERERIIEYFSLKSFSDAYLELYR